jgi:hypothetical protein
MGVSFFLGWMFPSVSLLVIGVPVLGADYGFAWFFPPGTAKLRAVAKVLSTFVHGFRQASRSAAGKEARADSPRTPDRSGSLCQWVRVVHTIWCFCGELLFAWFAQ